MLVGDGMKIVSRSAAVQGKLEVSLLGAFRFDGLAFGVLVASGTRMVCLLDEPDARGRLADFGGRVDGGWFSASDDCGDADGVRS